MSAKIIGSVPWIRGEVQCYKVPYDSQSEARKVAHQKLSQKACRCNRSGKCRTGINKGRSCDFYNI